MVAPIHFSMGFLCLEVHIPLRNTNLLYIPSLTNPQNTLPIHI